jgi:hypothetical protein
MSEGDKLLREALNELIDLDRQLSNLDVKYPVEFFADRMLLQKIREYLATRTEG